MPHSRHHYRPFDFYGSACTRLILRLVPTQNKCNPCAERVEVAGGGWIVATHGVMTIRHTGTEATGKSGFKNPVDRRCT